MRPFFTSRPALTLAAAIVVFFIAGAFAPTSSAQSSSFTYQGELKDGETPINVSEARFNFRLYDAESEGTQIGTDCVVFPVRVIEGIFTVLVDFGDTAFNGNDRWIEVGVDPEGTTNYRWMEPRQRLTAAPMATFALHGGDSPWSIASGRIYYTGGNVGIGISSPQARLHVQDSGIDPVIKSVSYEHGNTEGTAIYGQLDVPDGAAIHGNAAGTGGEAVGVLGTANWSYGMGVKGTNAATSGTPVGVYGSSRAGTGYAVMGINEATSGNAIGVAGRSDSPTGFGGYFLGRGYFSERVGIGTTSPTTHLDVNGTVRTNGFQLDTSPTDGYILTSDEAGVGSWQPAPTVGGYWTDGDNPGEIVYTGGQVGIGLSSPLSPLHVSGQTTSDSMFTTILRSARLQIFTGYQEGHVLTSDGLGYATWQPAPSGGAWENGTGDDIYYSLGNVGIGTAYPSAPLDVIGTVEMGGFKLSSSPQSGYVLTSDASGNGTWQPAVGGGLTLPYSGSVDSNSSAFKVTNTGDYVTSHAIHGVINNAGGSADQSAGFFTATGSNGHAVSAFGDGGSNIYSDHDGSSWAFWGTSSGSGGGYFSSTASNGYGVEGRATGEAGNGVYATASGGGAALMAEATGASTICLVAKGSSVAGRFYGNVDIYEYGTTNKVIELGKGLDYAEGFDVTEAKEAEIAKGTVLVIDPDNPGHLTMCRQAYDNKVAGIVAGANGLGSGVRLGGGQFDHDVALAGRVYCNVVALDDDIQPGDLLTTSNVPGHAMEVRDPGRAPGAVLGKAMEPLAKGQKGQILVLVTLQ